MPRSISIASSAALYAAKNGGRNQAFGYEALLAGGRLQRKEARADLVLF